MTQTWNYFSIILFQKWYLIKSDIWLGKSFSNIHRRALRVTKVSSPFLQLKILRGFLPLLHQVSRNSYMKLISWRGIKRNFSCQKLKCLDNKWGVRPLSDSLKICYLNAEVNGFCTTQLGFAQNKLAQPLQSLLVTSYLFFKCFRNHYFSKKNFCPNFMFLEQICVEFSML